MSYNLLEIAVTEQEVTCGQKALEFCEAQSGPKDQPDTHYEAIRLAFLLSKKTGSKELILTSLIARHLDTILSEYLHQPETPESECTILESLRSKLSSIL